jgi:hypothetical protein
MRKTKHRGIAAVAADFLLNLIAYNLIRIPKLVGRSPRPIEGTKARSIAKNRPSPERTLAQFLGFSANC